MTHSEQHEIIRRLGRQTIADLHREDWRYDLLACMLIIGAFAVNVWGLATLDVGWVWAALLVLQGFVLMIFGFIMHELFIHRQFGGPFLSWVGSMFFGLPVLILPTVYLLTHPPHHNRLGAPEDPDGYKSDLDTIWKRFLFLTFPGLILASIRKLATQQSSHLSQKTGYFVITENCKDKGLKRRISAEKFVSLLFFAAITIGAFYWPLPILCGYVLPLVLTLPIANTFRTILEHAEMNRANVLQIATFYRTNWFSRLLFFWDIGECHIIHHLFPQIPFYNMDRALKLIRPILLEKGVVERTSILQLLYGWFGRNETYGRPWFQE